MKIDLIENTPEDNSAFIREYINPAVYIETPCNMALRDSCFNLPGSGDRLVKVKRCLCFTNPKECPCHSQNDEEDSMSPRQLDGSNLQNDSASSLHLSTSNVFGRTKSSSRLSRCTIAQSATSLLIKESKPNLNDDYEEEEEETGEDEYDNASTNDTDLHLSIPSLTTLSSSRFIDDKQEHFRAWLERKKQQKKLQEKKQIMEKEMKVKQRERQVEEERENFRKWLENKKKDEILKKKQARQKEEKERAKEEERQTRMEENRVRYEMWLKKKESMTVQKKIKEQSSSMKKEEERKRRTEYSSKAYQLWLEKSKGKPKPVPLNRGLASLKSSASVTYINPQPWVPNIEIKDKP